MAAVMGDGDDHQEFLHLLGDARFSTLRQRCVSESWDDLPRGGIDWCRESLRVVFLWSTPHPGCQSQMKV